MNHTRMIACLLGEQHEGPFYVRQPFTQEPDWAVTSINLDLGALLARATPVEGAP